MGNREREKERDGGASGEQRSVASSHGTIEAIRNFIRSRYNNGFLNLENMSHDSMLRAAKIVPPGQTKGRSDVGTVMMKVAAELFPETTTISFAMNGLKSLQPISSVAQFFPNLQNLSLKSNDIREYKDLEYLSGGKKLPRLRELILLDNPVRDRDIEKNKDDLQYRSTIATLFPALQILDQLPIAPKISFGLGDLLNDAGGSGKVVLPAPVKGNFFDNPATQTTVLEFLENYLKLFDSNRSRLEHAYDANATFSFATMQLPSLLQKKRGDPSDNWSVYHAQSRNMTRVKDLEQRTKRLHYGNKDIIQEGLMKLPETKHDLSDATKFCIDAWQTGGLLPAVCIYISMHGAFEEVHHGRQGVLKSFDRTFIIAPAPPNSPAAMNGWRVVIISDQIIVRSYNGSDAWKPSMELSVPSSIIAAMSGVPAAGLPVPVPHIAGVPTTPQEPMPGVTPEQHAKAQDLQRLTGLNYPYAIQCLSACDWDIKKGVVLVSENRASIPKDAWQQPKF
ncbi:MAG: hypothetical protein J3Q66DRAFT_275631 [Benniella sp.]|nr:MAG: hypothetical protein J3Q66DRAFT_275631 [Benniella sp.]